MMNCLNACALFALLRRKVKDIFFATSIDYESGSEQARKFYAAVQNKFHFVITGYTLLG